MHTLLSSSLLSLGLLVSSIADNPATGPKRAIAQTTAPTKKAIRPRPAAPDTNKFQGLKRPEGVTPINRKGSRYQPLKPTIRPRGLKPAEMSKRQQDKRIARPPDKIPPGRTKHIRTPPMENNAQATGQKEPEGKGDAKAIEKDKKCRPLPSRVRIKMNFNEAEVIEIVQWISKQTCKNFIIGDNIRGGKITILSNTAVTANEAYRAFLSALNVNNMTVVKVGNFLKIQMKRDAAKDTIPTYIGEEVDPWARRRSG
jgi:hypothetical protein